jgi:flagellar biosynthesis protein FliP
MLILKPLLGSIPFFISYRIIINGFDILIQTLGNTGATRYIFI